VPISGWMMSLAAVIQGCFKKSFAMNGALSIWSFPIAVLLPIFIQATKFHQMQFMLHPRVFGQEPMLSASGLTTIIKNCPKLLQKVLITEEEINKHLLRVLVGRFDLGEMDDDALVPWTKIPMSVVNNDEHRKLALDMALESMTLLQNKNNILPLKKSKKIAVIGPNANDKPMLWGNYNGTPVRTITILDGITSNFQPIRLYMTKDAIWLKIK
jgi:hypothetical protein